MSDATYDPYQPRQTVTPKPKRRPKEKAVDEALTMPEIHVDYSAMAQIEGRINWHRAGSARRFS